MFKKLFVFIYLSRFLFVLRILLGSGAVAKELEGIGRGDSLEERQHQDDVG